MLKVLTLNLHCFAESQRIEKQTRIVENIAEEQYDVIFLQEVAQSKEAAAVPLSTTIFSHEVRADNYAYSLLKGLKRLNHRYHMIYSVSNEAFGHYDEGLAILSKTPFLSHHSRYVSKIQHYHDWRSRKIVYGDTIIKDRPFRWVSVHLGWSDDVEVFETQFARLSQLQKKNTVTLFAGDFNVPDTSSEYAYTQLTLRDLAQNLNSLEPTHGEHRIDYIMSSYPFEAVDYRTLFKSQSDAVSDHRGVAMTLKLL